MSGIEKQDLGNGSFALAIKRKKTRLFELTDEDFAIATRSKGALEMVLNDMVDEDDMLTLALMRASGMPKNMLGLGPSEIMHASQEAFVAAVERQGATVQ